MILWIEDTELDSDGELIDVDDNSQHGDQALDDDTAIQLLRTQVHLTNKN